MSSNVFTEPLTLNIKPSALYRAGLIALHGAIMGLSLVLIHHRVAVALLFALLLLNMIYWLRLANKPATLRLTPAQTAGQGWQVSYAADQQPLVSGFVLAQPAFVRTWMISLRLRRPEMCIRDRD